MKNGQEIGLSVISPKSKKGDTNIKRLLYSINQVFYDYNKRYITPQIASNILNQLKAYGVELKELEVKKEAEDKKTEILSELRNRCQSIIQYKNEFKWTNDTTTYVERTMKYQLSMYIKNRDNDSFDVPSYLKRNKEIWVDMYLPCPNHEKINTTKFRDMQNELIERLNEPYLLD